MKKYLVIAWIVFAFANSVKAQQIIWDSLGSHFGLDGNFGGVMPVVKCMAVYNNKLYAGGEFADHGPLPLSCIGAWDGTRWDSLGSGMPNSLFGPSALATYNGDLYAGGATIYTAGGVPVHNIAKWNGASWSKVGSGISVYGTIYAMAVYNGNLYVGGTFDTAGGIPVNNIAMWNGTTWSAVGGGITGWSNYTSVKSLFVYNGELYVGGEFYNAGGNPAFNIATWNGTKWSALGVGGVYGGRYSVNAITSYNGNLYVAGIFDTAGNIPAKNIAMWNGSTWSALGNGITPSSTSFGQGVLALCSYNNLLYVGGGFDTVGAIPDSGGVASWDGTKWAYVAGFKGGPIVNQSPAVWGLTVYNGYLFACGYFDSTSTFRSDNIAGNFPSNTGVNTLSNSISSISIYPNPNNGAFTLQAASYQPLANSSIEIYNMLGAQVYSNYQMTKSSNYQIDLSNQPAGVYLYRVISASGNLLGEGKIVIEK